MATTARTRRSKAEPVVEEPPPPAAALWFPPARFFLNTASLFVCPDCAVIVMDHEPGTANREKHYLYHQE